MDDYLRNLRAIRRRIEANIPNIEKYKYNKTVLIEIKSLLEEELTNFTVNWEEFYSFLSTIESETPGANVEKSAQIVIKKALEEKVEIAVTVINKLLTDIDKYNEQEEIKSEKSGSKLSSSSRSSKSKSMSDMLIQKKVKAETARARLQFVQEEERLKREQFDLELQVLKSRSNMESNLNILKCNQEILETEAELKAVEEIVEEGTISGHCSSAGKSQLPAETCKKSDIVKNYIENLPETQDQYIHIQSVTPPEVDKRLSANSPEFIPEAPDHGMSVLTKYIMKKDLLLSRLSSFDDKAERYFSWKNSFQNITRELEVTPTEEIDLLLRYLGHDSKRQAVSIRVANSHDNNSALEKIWRRLDQRFGAPEQVAESLRARVEQFSKVTGDKHDKSKLYDLSDLLEEIECVKSNKTYHVSMSYFDSSMGVNAVLCKLPTFIQNKWVDHCSAYKTRNNVMYPPFSVFVNFVKNLAIKLNDPSFIFDRSASVKSTNRTSSRLIGERQQQGTGVYSRKTTANSDNDKPKGAKEPYCVLHGENSRHELKDCKTFLQKSILEKREIVKRLGLCFKCMTYKHLASDCKVSVKCEKCNKTSHCTAFHIDPELSRNHGGEPSRPSAHGGEPKDQINPRCTEICGSDFGGKSCAKTVLVSVYPVGEKNKAKQCYAIIDDQSNRTLGKSELFDCFGNNSTDIQEDYTLSTCAGSFATVGRRISGLVVESHDATCVLKCPPVLECNDIPDNKSEIATPNIARSYPHLKDIALLVPELHPQANILLLIGRDMLEAHHVLDQRVGSNSEPYAQQLRLGWTIIGETCLGKVHQSNTISANKISVLYDGRSTILKPCESVINVKENNVFTQTLDDDTVGMSQDDKQFIKIMKGNMTKMSNGHLSAPLPFKEQKPRLPSNYKQAERRTETLVKQLNNNPRKCEQFVEFMGKIFDNNQAEVAPPVEPSEEVWYLPIFGVFHPKKPDKIRVVFDSAAKFQGLSLNDVLLTGPDLTNNLASVLTNFRRERFAAMADVEQMFLNFEVHQEHRNFLRFIWFQDNDRAKPLIDYRMRVHVFGNSPSPAVAVYGMRKAVCDHAIDSGKCDSVCNYVSHNFYVDDGLVSKADENELVDLIKQTQKRLLEGGSIRLHKIVSNSPKVLSSFPPTDLAKDITEIDFNAETPCFQRSLGISWDVVNDIFTYKVPLERKPYTKRGLLSTINGLFDPLGFVAPVVLGGRLIMKKAVQDQNLDWDDPLSENLKKEWISWQDSLTQLEDLEIPRTFTDLSFDNSSMRELHVFSDASKEAISAVAYLRIVGPEGNSQIGFVQGKSKLAPSHGHTIPRLELCAAVIATELAAFVQKHLNITAEHTYYYTDSQVVLGYINNKSRRFYVYVANRVDKILKLSSRVQWNFVPTEKNPADHGTRPVKAENMKDCKWLQGPELSESRVRDNKCDDFELIDPRQDSEVRPVIESKKVEVKKSRLGCHRFERFSSWSGLVSAMSYLKQKAASCNKDSQKERNNVEFKGDTEEAILREIQAEEYSSEIECLRKGKPVQRKSRLVNLSPMLDSKGLLRAGGRLKNATLDTGEKTPVIIPGKSHIAILLVRHYHEKAAHQGRYLTEGAVRSAGFWVTGGKRLINSVIHNCVRCRRLRRPIETQKMSDLPSCRVTASAPFTYVGVDTFGPWSILTRKTRGGASNSKRWAILFSCLYTRAVHIEVVEDMSASCFINALRRFIAIRGPVKEFYSDRGTNFVGAVSEIGINKICVEDLHSFLEQQDTVWYFNTPHSSHMNGAWERMIGLARRILESLLCDSKHLTHEVLCTLMAEVMCIINSRPITADFDDPTTPTILSPNMLLTHKENSDIEPRKDLGVKDMYRSQWRHVQLLADQFWKRWKSQYLQNLQTRQKWQREHTNVKTGDVVLLVDDNLPRIQWQVGVIDEVYPSSDNLVRKVSVRVIKDGSHVCYMRPIAKLVHLFSQ